MEHTSTFEEDIWNLFEGLDINKKETDLDDNEPKCSNCLSIEFDFDENNYICKNCGTVNSKVIDLGAEWRYYGCDDNKLNNPTRC